MYLISLPALFLHTIDQNNSIKKAKMINIAFLLSKLSTNSMTNENLLYRHCDDLKHMFKKHMLMPYNQ